MSERKEKGKGRKRRKGEAEEKRRNVPPNAEGKTRAVSRHVTLSTLAAARKGNLRRGEGGRREEAG